MPSERMPQADPSWISYPLRWLTRAVARFPVLTLLIAVAAMAGSIWLTMTQLGFRTSRADLISPQSEYHHRWLEYTREFGEREDVVVVVEGKNRQTIAPALDDLCRELRRRADMFSAVMHETDAPALRAKGLYYLKTDDLLKIDGFLQQATPILQGNWSQLNLGGMAQWMGTAMGGGSDAQRGQIMAAMQAELPRVSQGLTAALGSSGGYQSPWPEIAPPKALADEAKSTRLMSDDGRLGFVLLKLIEEDRQSFAQNKESIKVLREITAGVQTRHPGTKLGLTGLPIIEYDEMRSSEDSMSAATLVSFFGVLAVMIVAFGGFRHAIMAMTALVIGMIWACGCVTLTIGYVNVLSIAFASILFGMGIDYGIYYIARYLQLREQTTSTTEALVHTSSLVGPGILTGACTSAISFFASGLTDFPGVAQLGLIAGGGVLLCWLAETTILPAMIRLSDKDGERQNLPTALNLKFWLRPLFAFPKISLLLVAAMTVVLSIGLRDLYYDYNLLNLQPKGLECVELEHKLFTQTNRSAWFALSIAKTPEEAAARREKFLKLPSVERVVEVATKLPGDLERKRPIVERIHARVANLPSQVPAIPVTPAAELVKVLTGAESMLASQPGADAAVGGLRQLREMLQRIPPDEYQRRVGQYQQAMAGDLLTRLQMLQASSNPEPPRLTDLPESIRSRFIGKSNKFLIQVYSKANIWEVEPMDRFVRDVRSVDPDATGNPIQVHEASLQMKHSFEQAAWYALLAIVPLVFLDFRRLSHTLLAAIPMGVGLLQTLGMMGLLGISLNPANMILLPLAIGLGMDTGINLVHEMRCQRGRYQGAGNAVVVAVVVNTLTTMVGFGALMIANHQGLQSLGRALTISMAFGMLDSLLLPNLLVVGRFSGDAPMDDEDPSQADLDVYDETVADEEESSVSYAA
ncbi:MAG: MMPL family transporter [Thermoguttaceae bacterium]